MHSNEIKFIEAQKDWIHAPSIGEHGEQTVLAMAEKLGAQRSR
jgi:hypothetical protein